MAKTKCTNSMISRNHNMLSYPRTSSALLQLQRRRSPRILSSSKTLSSTSLSSSLNNDDDKSNIFKKIKIDQSDQPRKETKIRSKTKRLDHDDDDASKEIYPDVIASSINNKDYRNKNPTTQQLISTSSETTTTVSSSSSIVFQWMNHTDIQFHYFTSIEATKIQTKLLHWYRTNRRKLPWRGDAPPWNGSTAGNTIQQQKQQPMVSKHKNFKPSKELRVSNDTNKNDDHHIDAPYLHCTYPVTPYGVWVSEIMLQQTRVEAVIIKWCQFIHQYPTIHDLANAKYDDINTLWAGLGYYRRAKLLHTAAQQVVVQYHGIIPTTIQELQQLPGIGKYTAHAIASICFHIPVPVVDGNVCRVLSRLRCVTQHIKDATFKDKYGYVLAEQIIQANHGLHPGEVNQAMMELGATYCSPSGTGVDQQDPLIDHYWSTQLGYEMAQYKHHHNITMTELLYQTTTTNINSNNEQHCPLCSSNGMLDVVTQFDQSYMDNETNHDSTSIDTIMFARQLGHRLFPLSPPKVHKKEEVYVVAVISISIQNTTMGHEPQWLFIKRPEGNKYGGLLAGQWEFPSICVWQSSDVSSNSDGNIKTTTGKRQRTDMSHMIPILDIPSRQQSIQSLMKEICTTTQQHDIVSNMKFITINQEPITHIFSHVRHTIYIEYASIVLDDHNNIGNDNFMNDMIQQFCTSNDTSTTSSSSTSTVNGTHHDPKRIMQFMSINQIGLTSGVKKIYTTVMNAINTSPSTNQSKTPSKRKKRQ